MEEEIKSYVLYQYNIYDRYEIEMDNIELMDMKIVVDLINDGEHHQFHLSLSIVELIESFEIVVLLGFE